MHEHIGLTVHRRSGSRGYQVRARVFKMGSIARGERPRQTMVQRKQGGDAAVECFICAGIPRMPRRQRQRHVYDLSCPCRSVRPKSSQAWVLLRRGRQQHLRCLMLLDRLHCRQIQLPSIGHLSVPLFIGLRLPQGLPYACTALMQSSTPMLQAVRLIDLKRHHGSKLPAVGARQTADARRFD
eukprot:scaffold30415_cov124-Isochrysis_galbana.AAC.16